MEKMLYFVVLHVFGMLAVRRTYSVRIVILRIAVTDQ